MGAFHSAVITAKGQALLAKAVLNTVDLEFTRIAVSENKLTGDLVSKAGIGTVKQEAKVASVKRTNNSSVKVGASIANNNLTSGYYVRNIGLYAKDPDEGEILYSISVADESTATADWMPPYNGVGVSSLMIDLITVVGNSDNVKVEVDPTAFATVAQIIEVNEHLTALDNTIITTTERSLRGSVAGGLKINKVSGLTRKCTNLFDKSKTLKTETDTGFSFTWTGTDGAPTSLGTLKTIAPQLKVGDRVALYGTAVNSPLGSGVAVFYLVGTGKQWRDGEFITITGADLEGGVNVYGSTNLVCEYKDIRITKVENAPYEPYFEGLRSVEISEIKTHGKNLLNARLGVEIGGNDAYTLNNIKPNTKYTFTLCQEVVALGSSRDSQHWYKCKDSAGNVLKQGQLCKLIFNNVGEVLTATETITTPAGTVSMTIDIGSYNQTNSNTVKTIYAQAEESPVATEYEPYTEKIVTLTQPIVVEGIPVSSGGNYTDENGQQWLCNEVDLVSGKIIKRVGRKTLDGSESWQKFDGFFGVYTSAFDNEVKPHSQVLQDGIWKVVISQGSYIAKIDLEYTIDAWKAYLAENPMTVCYELANPETVDISASLPIVDQIALRSLLSHNGVTTILTDSKENPHIEVEYGTNKTGAHTLSGLLTAQRNELKLAELTSAVLALNQE